MGCSGGATHSECFYSFYLTFIFVFILVLFFVSLCDCAIITTSTGINEVLESHSDTDEVKVLMPHHFAELECC